MRGAGFRGSIVGWNRSPEQGQVALRMGALDPVAEDPLQTARESDVVLLAVPVYATLARMEQLAPHLGGDHLVTDVGSTKAKITQVGMAHFNQMACASFLPGHPMAGKERGGAALADAELFRGAVWIFTDVAGCVRSKRALAAH